MDPTSQNATKGTINSVFPQRRRFPLFGFSSVQIPEELASFDDDEALPVIDLDSQLPGSQQQQQQEQGVIEVKTYPELSAVAKSSSHQNFNILIHMKAPKSSDETTDHNQNKTSTTTTTDNSRAGAPLDLVAVLDVSGSMDGSKLALMKQAMGFVIQNLGPSDRLSIVSFSDRSQRICPLRLMNQSGKQFALQSVHNLTILGGTHIAAGLQTGAKVMTDRRYKNPVASIIFLSDGCDTYTVNNQRSNNNMAAGYDQLIPSSIRPGENRPSVPIHTFGFGSDHDPALMNTVAEATRGTFSFVESVDTIQDAFAQCIGGLLSVVVQELQVKVESDHKDLRLSSIKAGSYKTYIPLDARTGFIEVGDLYAEEERNFLVEIDIPQSSNSDSIMQVLKISYAYKCPISKQLITRENVEKASIERPEFLIIPPQVSVEVDRERSRVETAEAIAKAKAEAEEGNLAGAKGTLEECRGRISGTRLRRRGEGDLDEEKVLESLEEELLEIEKKMVNMRVYMKSGRALAMSGLNSHMQQRAATTSFGFGSKMQLDTCSATRSSSYQTPHMAKMVQQSRRTLNSNSADQRLPPSEAELMPPPPPGP
ncbi:E3 ubiquitin-protein ligase WAV3-like [Impatiens glandulifera]|uniref:E3 ubiquitin-protein ligase WAV3-like n=1 Tax=Impatiens glandulifera TaxID=253017 RepID=UPI001FB11DC9|nr:E3 ubiquitin-protein ligase WAV3-like [Impatiens glandulifera]